jgi:hypothetical protein
MAFTSPNTANIASNEQRRVPELTDRVAGSNPARKSFRPFCLLTPKLTPSRIEALPAWCIET